MSDKLNTMCAKCFGGKYIAHHRRPAIDCIIECDKCGHEDRRFPPMQWSDAGIDFMNRRKGPFSYA